MRPSLKTRINNVSKYGNKIVQHEGETFHSKGELRRYLNLKLLEKAGKISNLKRQVPFELLPSFKYNGKTVLAMKYVMDFTYIENGKSVAEDFKGWATADNLLKQKLFKYKYRDIELRITK